MTARTPVGRWLKYDKPQTIMPRLCSGVTKSGLRCESPFTTLSGYCKAHRDQARDA